MISRALSALRFVPHSKTKLAPFEAYHGREANTALQNLTKKPEWLKRHKTSTTTVYQKTGKTDPKDPRRYKTFTIKN